MKLQNLIVIFSIIVIPIVLILSAYVQIQIDTASLQEYYDTKLLDATHDAVAAFQLNTMYNTYSTNSDSMRRDIKAAINTFSNSLSKSMGFGTAVTSTIGTYIPAIVFTLYDGYYIYSPDFNGKTDYEHLLKPYIYYSAKYKSGNSFVVVNYSLDNFITVYGNVNGEYVYNSGYIIDTNRVETIGNQIIGYKVDEDTTISTIDAETLNVIDENTGNNVSKQDFAAKEYYQDAYKFSKWLQDTGICNIVRPSNAIRSDGREYKEAYNTIYNANNEEVLRFSKENADELGTSSFNQHKRDIMKISIQENLNSAIQTYSRHSQALGSTASFTMPKLTEKDWEKMLTNVNMVTFMQGLQVGAKVYNNYAIITSTNNKQYVSPDAVYFTDGSGNYHRINCPSLADNNIVGYKSIDFQRRKKSTDDTNYYYLHDEYGCYRCIVDTLDEGIDISKLSNNKKKAYYYALAREKNNLYKTTEKNTIKSKVLVIGDDATRGSNTALSIALNGKFENVTYDYVGAYASNDKIIEEAFELVIFSQSTANNSKINDLYAKGVHVVTMGNFYDSGLDIIDSTYPYSNDRITPRKVNNNTWFDNMPNLLSIQSNVTGNIVERFKEGTETIYNGTLNSNGRVYPCMGLYTNKDRVRWLHVGLQNDNNLLENMPELIEYMLTKTNAISLPTDITNSNYTLPLTFNGINQYQPMTGVKVSLNGINTMSMSTTFIPKAQVGAGEHAILSSGANEGWKIIIDENGYISAKICINGAYVTVTRTLETIKPGKIYHVTCVYDGANIKLYVNGELAKTQNASGNISQRTDIPTTISASPFYSTMESKVMYREYFNGEVKNVRVYKEALSPSQIQELWRRDNIEFAIENEE